MYECRGTARLPGRYRHDSRAGDSSGCTPGTLPCVGITRSRISRTARRWSRQFPPRMLHWSLARAWKKEWLVPESDKNHLPPGVWRWLRDGHDLLVSVPRPFTQLVRTLPASRTHERLSLWSVFSSSPILHDFRSMIEFMHQLIYNDVINCC